LEPEKTLKVAARPPSQKTGLIMRKRIPTSAAANSFLSRAGPIRDHRFDPIECRVDGRINSNDIFFLMNWRYDKKHGPTPRMPFYYDPVQLTAIFRQA
jgi:hypothetical protein